MKAVVQRVIDASVTVNDNLRGHINSGLLVYLGVAQNDAESDACWLAEKIANLRIFDDSEGKMNLSIKDIGGSVLTVSQFTLLGDARKGRRPSWGRAAPPEQAKALYEYFMGKIREQSLVCESGEFQTHMKIRYTNDGPVTILLDTEDIL
ncbi:D-aminoacyl-tRNA deacylase [Spirochaetia bacterium]|nr:D-aminoacyl-tRNA deacylase [Spirochaetia bacterium]